jgi:CheY-like chemotaxis protein
MERSILNRIFDPYFSTKHQGEGTGLGLAVVHGIITSYKGDIQVHSRPGQGTRFDILLPVTQNHQPADNNQILLEDLPSGTEHILYVDDEALIVEIYEGMLKHLGYDVTAMTSSIEAWRLFETQPHRFDLVITDMTMPQLTGDVLSARILKLRPDIPIILYTGYSDRLSQQQANIMGIKKYLKKPVVIQQLAGAIRETLDARQP